MDCATKGALALSSTSVPLDAKPGRRSSRQRNGEPIRIPPSRPTKPTPWRLGAAKALSLRAWRSPPRAPSSGIECPRTIRWLRASAQPSVVPNAPPDRGRRS